jgi:hypothetical protein
VPEASITMMEHTAQLFIGFAIAILTGVFSTRWIARMVDRAECRIKARDRLQKKTGWDRLDAINQKLLDAYARLENHG